MRAGPLSHPAVIQLLNTRFVNTWVLKQELPALQKTAKTSGAARLAAAVFDTRQPKSPVDCVVFSPDLAVLGCQPANDFIRAGGNFGDRYRTFLTEALDKPTKK
jgi:hypothetical protein